MQGRLLLFKIVTLMLYAGPLLAGLAGHGWAVLPAFAAIFVLWQIVMRPTDWPREPGRWTDPGVLTGAGARVALMIVLVAVMFGIGRGIGGVAGHISGLPAGAALALSFLSVPLARLLWNPRAMAEMDGFLTDAIDQVNAAAASEAHDPDHAAQAVQPLILLTDDTPDATARAGMFDRLSGPATAARLRALAAALAAAPGDGRAARRGLILWAADRVVAERQIGAAAQTHAFEATAGDAALLHLFATEMLPLIVALPEAWYDFPMTEKVREAAAKVDDETTARALLALAEAMDEAERRVDGDGDGGSD